MVLGEKGWYVVFIRDETNKFREGGHGQGDQNQPKGFKKILGGGGGVLESKKTEKNG